MVSYCQQAAADTESLWLTTAVMMALQDGGTHRLVAGFSIKWYSFQASILSGSLQRGIKGFQQTERSHVWPLWSIVPFRNTLYMIKDPSISSLHARVLTLLNSHHIKMSDHMGTDRIDRGVIPFCSSSDSEVFFFLGKDSQSVPTTHKNSSGN